MSDENLDTTQDVQGSADQLAAIRALSASKGLDLSDLGDAHDGGQDGPAPEPANADAQPEDPAEQEAAPHEPPKAPDPKNLLDKVAAKDAALQREKARARDLEKRLQQLEQQAREESELFARDPLTALHRKGLTRAQLAEQWLERGDAPAEESKDKQAKQSALPPEIQRELQELKQWKEQQQQELAQYRAQQQRAQQVGVLKLHLSKLPEFELLNDMDAHEAVYDAVIEHLAGGQFEDEEHAASVISVLAQREENRLREQVRGYLSKPKVRAFLERELRGTQSEARSPRQEPRGTAPSNDARSPLSNDITQQRTLRPPPEDGWNQDDAWQRALEEAGRIQLPL